MTVKHSAIRLENADPIARLPIPVRALNAQHLAASGFTRCIGGIVRVGNWPCRRSHTPVARRWPTPTTLSVLRLYATDC